VPRGPNCLAGLASSCLVSTSPAVVTSAAKGGSLCRRASPLDGGGEADGAGVDADGGLAAAATGGDGSGGLAIQNIPQASAQDVASTKQTESAAQNLHELGRKLKWLVEQYQVEHTRHPMNDLNPERAC